MLVRTYPGPSAASGFRLDRLAGELRVLLPALKDLSASYLHIVHLRRSLTLEEENRLGQLLAYGQAVTEVVNGKRLLVVPRIGTISPWSSKATDIARICGLDAVIRMERGVQYALLTDSDLDQTVLAQVRAALHDRMTETVLDADDDPGRLFAEHEPAPLGVIELGEAGSEALEAANRRLGLALSTDEMEYLLDAYRAMGRDPTDAELMMFAQANSEHCRHKIFNADWIADGEALDRSLFDMIRATHGASPDGVLSAYKDNAAVMRGGEAQRLVVEMGTGEYGFVSEPVHTLMKVETHNHPTAISPFPGAATGSGGEIRDEGATGRGAQPRAGLTGFTVSHLALPGFEQPWEKGPGQPARIATPLQIMLEGPIGGAAFNNEFGRPNLAGYFRTFQWSSDNRHFGYHKPIMIAGGLGSVREPDVEKSEIPPGAILVVLGGPAMLIGLGGGAASSMGSGTSTEDLDFASVQRGNPEIQRRCQQVIDACWSLGVEPGGHNPVLAIHDVGAGGLSNAVPELVDHSRRGGRFELREVPVGETGMSPLEIWCNEAQERYVLALLPEDLETFRAICERERCPFAVLGTLDDTRWLRVSDRLADRDPVNMPMEVLLGKPPRTVMEIARQPRETADLDLRGIELEEACRRVLRFPAVADKSFLIHIGDRTVGGMVARDQLVGPWQVPVGDAAVTTRGFNDRGGDAMAMGERIPVAVLDPAASVRLAVAEAVTNLIAADVRDIRDIRLSANWMAASGVEGEDQALLEGVSAVSALCCELGIVIPVGKDSLSMRTAWEEGESPMVVAAPLSLIVSAFAPVIDAGAGLDPQLSKQTDTELWLVDLGNGKNRLGMSCLAQAFEIRGGAAPDLDDAAQLGALVAAMVDLRDQGLALAYHDRSDGGLFATLCEMAFAGRTGLDIEIEQTNEALLSSLFAEEPGVCLQVHSSERDRFIEILSDHGLRDLAVCVGRVSNSPRVRIHSADGCILDVSRTELHQEWSELSFRLQGLRDNPETTRQARSITADEDDPGLNPRLSFDPRENPAGSLIASGARPRVAVLREQGVNSHQEMAAALHRAGFAPIDVHMTDILDRGESLASFRGLVACGGFSYGDVLGAGGGWARSILYNDQARAHFADFFSREDTFSLGICNGCQMLSALHEIIPGTRHWPRFVRNLSEQFEARLSLVEIQPGESVLLNGMEGSHMLIATSHGEGRAEFSNPDDLKACNSAGQISLRFVNHYGEVTETYPSNPNGSPQGVAGLCSSDGRATIFMPHPERLARTIQHSWHPPGWGEDGPWMRMFYNARLWVN